MPTTRAAAGRSTTLLTRMAQINTAGLEVVYAGDFNSNKSRGTYNESTGFGAQDTVGRTFAAAGYYDAYDLARTLKRPNWNSVQRLQHHAQGEHRPGATTSTTCTSSQAKTNVWRWMNAALYSGSSYKTPMPSDHSPVQVDLYIP